MKLRNPLNTREKFLILEVSPRGTNGLFLSVDEDRSIIFEKLAKGIDLKKFFKSPVRNVSEKAWEGKHFFKSRRKVIVAADPSLATTIPIPVELSREHANIKTKLTIAELENLIAQAMAKIFNGCRSEAAKRLRMNDLDAILVAAKVKYFKIDGKMVMNPAGFAGKKISLLLELTFTSRELFEDLKQFFNSSDNFFFAEAPQVQLASFSRVRKLPLNLIVVNEGDASLYILENAKDEYEVLYRETLPWSFSSLFHAISESLAVSDNAAKELYLAYHKGEMSETARKGFKKMLQPVLDDFWKAMGNAGVRGGVYIDVPHILPFELPHRHGGAYLEQYPIGEILAELGFTADPAFLQSGPGKQHEEKNVVLRPLLYFLEAYFDRSNSEINQKLRRRLHWLAN